MKTQWIDLLTKREKRKWGVCEASYTLARDPSGAHYLAYRIILAKRFGLRKVAACCDIDVLMLRSCSSDRVVLDIVRNEIATHVEGMRLLARTSPSCRDRSQP